MLSDGSRDHGLRIEEEQGDKAAAKKQWPFKDWEEAQDGLGCSAESSLCGGEREEEFVERLTVAIWQANGAYCDVLVTATYLEIEPPWQEHQLDEDDYERLIGTI